MRLYRPYYSKRPAKKILGSSRSFILQKYDKPQDNAIDRIGSPQMLLAEFGQTKLGNSLIMLISDLIWL